MFMPTQRAVLWTLLVAIVLSRAPRLARAQATRSFDEARAVARAEEATKCLPERIAALATEALRVAVEPNTPIAAEHWGRFAAVFTSRLEAGMPLCRAYASTLTGVAATWLTTLVAQPTAVYQAYCEHELADTVYGGRNALPLTHDDPLLVCLRVGMRAALLVH